MISETTSRREQHEVVNLEYNKRNDEITEGHRQLDQQKQELNAWYEATMRDIYK